jgi:hypothetical protein
MDIQESFHRILEQKHAMDRSFFTLALSSCHEACLLLWGKEGGGHSGEVSSPPPMVCAPLAMYAQFTSDLLRALCEFHGADWNAELMEQWRMAIERVGQAIFAPFQK